MEMNSNNPPTFSIIIPVKFINDYVRENIEHFQPMRSQSWELYIVTDHDCVNEWPSDNRINFLKSGEVGPAEKRDLAAKVSRGKYLVFLDDDSYPKSDFLEKLAKSFWEGDTQVVGGPGITPENDKFWAKVSGATFETKGTASDPRRYRSVGGICFLDDWPSVNLSILREIFLQVGGFDSNFWPGEDTEFCLKLKRAGFKIKYDPNVIVFHHRRPGLIRHLRQIGGYGIHRGYFARKYPENSRKFKYFIPSLFCGYIGTALLVESQLNQDWVLIPLIIYGFALFYYGISTFKNHSVSIALASLVFLVSSHIWYGVRFLQGFFFTSQLKSKLRK